MSVDVFTTVRCDACGELCRDGTVKAERSQPTRAVERAEKLGWQTLRSKHGEKHVCPRCVKAQAELEL